MQEELKRCSACRGELPKEMFNKDRQRADGLSSYCKPCVSEKSKERYARNAETVRTRTLDYYHSNKDKCRARMNDYVERNRDRLLEAGRQSYLANKEKLLEANKDWRNANKDKLRESRKAYRDLNKASISAAGKAWRDVNRSDNLERKKRYRLENRHKVAACNALRRAQRRQRTPAWLKPEDLKTMEGIYFSAQLLSDQTGIKFHVDHDLPMAGKYVSGLHVPSNLRIVTAIENMRKHNNWVPE